MVTLDNYDYFYHNGYNIQAQLQETPMDIFRYTQDELTSLKKKDKKLASEIERIGMIERPVNRDVFAALIDGIVSQQISGKAAQTVYDKLVRLCGQITPELVRAVDAESVQKCGMTMGKAGYIKAAADAVCDGELDLAALPKMSDSEVIEHLTALPGIGVWTAEMLLIFSLGRKDVLSFGDLAIRRGICKLYGHKELTKERFERYKKRYSPYGSIASLYLWEISV